MQPSFVHLHLHSEFSLIDSTIRLSEVVKRCAKMGMPALALTDQSNMFGQVKFYRAAEKSGVKPIVGADVWVQEAGEKPTRITLLCQNLVGYRNLSKLVSQAYLEGHQGDYVSVPYSLVRELGQGLIVLAGRESDFGQAIMEHRDEDAADSLSKWLTDFPNRFYLEITRTQREGELKFENAALPMAFAMRCPVVASNDVRFLEKEDFEAHEARVCISTGRVLGDPKRPRDYSPEQYLKSPEEMTALFSDLPGALENTLEIAKRCNLTLTFGEYALPNFPVPESHTLDSWIHAEAHKGLEERLANYTIPRGLTREHYIERLDREVGVICGMGFPGYFLIVADFINWAKRNDIPVGPGRGSGAGSLVAWALKITDIDPLPYGLLFERFLNPERVSMPDFDIDFCMDKRDQVIQYVADKYGRDHVSQIITYGTMAAKAAVRDSGRVMALSYGFVDGISKLIPNVLGIGLEDALGRTEASKKNADMVSQELISRYEAEEEVRDLLDLALKLEDLTRNAGKHAGGVVIGPKPLTEFSPLFAEPPSKVEGTNRSVVTQFDKDDVEAVGLVKFDFLGLRTLTIIDWAVKAINRWRVAENEPEIDISAISLYDRPTYDIFSQAKTVAVFQFESSGMQRLLKDARPDRFEDLIALVSLYRPGPMDLIPSFCARKHGEEVIEYADPRVEPVLKETYGIMVYQEQVMQMAQIIGGYSLGGADLLRRAMGKKKPEEMVKHRAIFRDGAAANGLDEFKADEIFDVMEKFAGYGFNKSHAAAYALVSYQTAWLKAHYPAPFMAAVLSSDMDNTDKVVTFLAECRAMGLKILPPNVNASSFMFEAVDPQTIRYGLGAIKGVGENACLEIHRLREENGPYNDHFDFVQRVGQKVNKRVHETLIDAGALDGLAPNRATMLERLPDMLRATDQMARDAAAGQFDIFGNATAVSAPIIPSTGDTPEMPLLALLKKEYDVLGHYLSGHPMDSIRRLVSSLITCQLNGVDEALEQRRFQRGSDANVLLAGQCTAVNRRNEDRGFVTIEDGFGRIEATLYGETLREYGEVIAKDSFLLIEGQLHEDRFRGGTGMRARRIWELTDYCRNYGQRIRFTLDTTTEGAVESVNSILQQWRGGHTALTVEVLSKHAHGMIDFDRGELFKSDPELINALNKAPGVSKVAMRLSRPPAAMRDRE